MMLQRTRANNVVPVYLNFFRSYPSYRKLSKTTVSKIEKILYPLGLKWRAVFYKKLGRYLVEVNGRIPRDLAKLKLLPGVGDYVASAWLSLHGGKRAIIIDSNVVRWLCRMVGVEMTGETRRQSWLRELVEMLTPEKDCKQYNYAVLDFSMTICKKNPICEICEFNKKELCAYPKRK